MAGVTIETARQSEEPGDWVYTLTGDAIGEQGSLSPIARSFYLPRSIDIDFSSLRLLSYHQRQLIDCSIAPQIFEA
jgi:hypothetical protein